MAARAKCPDIVFAHVATFLKGDTAWAYHENPRKATHKVSLDPYRRESRKIFGIFKEHCRVVEKASIDETYLDLGEVVYKRLLELFPELREDKLKPGAPLPEPPTLAQLWEKGVEWMGTLGCLRLLCGRVRDPPDWRRRWDRAVRFYEQSEKRR